MPLSTSNLKTTQNEPSLLLAWSQHVDHGGVIKVVLQTLQKTQLSKLLRAMLLVWLTFLGSGAHADWADMVRQMRTGTFTWRIRVVDEAGRLIPAATLWAVDVDETNGRNQAFLERMVRRYAVDADFVQFAAEPSHFVVIRTALDGKLNDIDSCICETRSSMLRAYAAIKRGYLPKMLSVTANRNSSVDVTIALSVDPDAKVDPRMLELDRLRASAHATGAASNAIMQQDRMVADRSVNQKIRALAQALEQDNQPDLASAVYYNLAYLPAVDSVVTPDGQEKIIGYTNGYSDRNPQRKADLDKAIELNQSVPILLDAKFRKATWSLDTSTLHLDWSKALIVEREKMIVQNGERLWPILYSIAPIYIKLGLFEKACQSLKRSRAFEPTYKKADGLYSWEYELLDLNKAATKAGYTGEECKY